MQPTTFPEAFVILSSLAIKVYIAFLILSDLEIPILFLKASNLSYKSLGSETVKRLYSSILNILIFIKIVHTYFLIIIAIGTLASRHCAIFPEYSRFNLTLP